MTEDKTSNSLWALSSLAIMMGDGAADFAADDQEFFRRQEFVFASLNLLLIGGLLALQVISRSVRGKPSASVIVVLVVGLVIQAAHLVWLGKRNAPISRRTRRFLTFWSIGFNSTLALALTSLTIRGDTAY